MVISYFFAEWLELLVGDKCCKHVIMVCLPVAVVMSWLLTYVFATFIKRVHLPGNEHTVLNEIAWRWSLKKL